MDQLKQFARETKENKKKLIYATFFLVFFAIFIWFFNIEKTTDKELNHMPIIPDLKIAFPSSSAAAAYEPTKIELAPEYIFLENIYSPLVEILPDGSLSAGVAQLFYWKNNEAHFEIRDDLVASDGLPITAEDAEFSLKRLLVLTGNTHGNFHDLVCGGKALEAVQDSCPGIIRKGNTLILKTSEQKPFLFPMLAAIDFAIIPKRSVDMNSLKIVNHKVTSGPYFVEHDSNSGNITLLANKNHYHFNTKMPQRIALVPSDKTSSFELFKTQKIDLITTIDKHRPEEQLNFYNSHNQELNMHKTMNIRTFMGIFSKDGLKKFSIKERFTIARILRENIGGLLVSHPSFEPTRQFFPVFGEGGISKEKTEKISEIESNSHEPISLKSLDISFTRIGDTSPFKTALRRAIPRVSFLDEKPGQTGNNSLGDLEITGPDTGFLEDISLLSYSIHFGMLTETPEQGEKWLSHYMSIPHKEERLKLLRELHYQALLNCIIVPMATAPYVALARKPWTLGLSQFYANNPFYFMRFSENY